MDMPRFAAHLPIREGQLHYLCPAGMGDLTWIEAKHWYTRQTRDVTYWFPAEEHRRAGALAQLYGAKFGYLPGLTTNWVWQQPGNPEIPDSGAVLAVHANRHLENGRRLEKWYPDLPFRTPDPSSTAVNFYEQCDRPKYVMCFMCQHHYMERGGNLLPGQWARLFREIEQTIAPVFVVGAGLDRELIEDVFKLYAPSLEPALDTPLADLIPAIKYATGMFGAAGGPTILATYLGVPTYHLYPRHLEKMANMWEQSDAVSDWRFLDEGTLPDTVERLRETIARGEYRVEVEPEPVVPVKPLPYNSEGYEASVSDWKDTLARANKAFEVAGHKIARIEGMPWGMGDNIWCLPILKSLHETYDEIYLHSPWPQLFRGFPWIRVMDPRNLDSEYNAWPMYRESMESVDEWAEEPVAPCEVIEFGKTGDTSTRMNWFYHFDGPMDFSFPMEPRQYDTSIRWLSEAVSIKPRVLLHIPMKAPGTKPDNRYCNPRLFGILFDKFSEQTGFFDCQRLKDGENTECVVIPEMPVYCSDSSAIEDLWSMAACADAIVTTDNHMLPIALAMNKPTVYLAGNIPVDYLLDPRIDRGNLKIVENSDVLAAEEAMAQILTGLRANG